VVLSEEVSCPNCGEPNLIWRKECVDSQKGKILDEFPCGKCRKVISKTECLKIWETRPDPCLPGSIWRIFRQRPVLIYYDVKGRTYCKIPDKIDIELFESFWNFKYPHIPISAIPKGDKTKELINGNTKYFHQCYHPYTLYGLNELLGILRKYEDTPEIREVRFTVSPIISSLTRMAVLHVSNFFNGGEVTSYLTSQGFCTSQAFLS